MALIIKEKDLLSSPDFIIDMVPKIEFWRTAIRAGFSDIFYKVISGKKVQNDKWLYKLDFESPVSYWRRAMTAKDPAWCEKIVTSYNGFFSKAKVTFNSGLSAKYNDYYENDINKKGLPAKRFKDFLFREAISVGQVWIMVDAENYFTKSDNPEEAPILTDVRPYVYPIKRENILDYNFSEGSTNFVKFKMNYVEFEGITRKVFTRIIIVTPDEWIIYRETKKNKFELEKSFLNPLGVIPMVKIDFGEDAVPIINTAAKYQLDIFNFQSEVRNTLSVQNINLLGMPASVAERLKKAKDGEKSIITAYSMLVWDDNYTGLAPSWIGPPANTLDPHFRYMEWLVKSLISMSNLRQKITAMAESAEAKAFEWLDTEAVLHNGKMVVEQAMEEIAKIFGLYVAEKNIQPKVTIEDEFQTTSLNDYLVNVIRADTIGLDEISMTEIRKKVRDMLVSLNPEMKKLSDEQLGQIIRELPVGDQIPV